MAERKLSLTATLHQCQHCGSGFYPKRTCNVTFCSRQCSLAQQKEKALPRLEINRRIKARQTLKNKGPFSLDCQICGRQFISAQPNTKRCSWECYLASLRRPKTQKTCRDCGVAIVGTAAKKLCKHCARQRYPGKPRERAKFYNVEYEPVNPIKVFHRDNWRCQLCNRKTPRSKRGSLSPNAPELDHILPLSKGGQHSYRNTQCACRACNIAKGSTPKGQTLLFG